VQRGRRGSSIIVGVGTSKIAGLILTPSAGARRDQSGLVAIDELLSQQGIAVERVEFPGQASGKRRPDPPEVCIETVRDASAALAQRLTVATTQVALGGRSFGGRMCSMAAAGGLDVAALALVSYPLHPPGRPERLRTSHFPDLVVPCLFVSGRRDAFATPEELERATASIPGEVTLVVIDGDHSLRRTEREAAAAVAAWAATINGQQAPEGGRAASS
jgi:predicted alpha/beta-hydrolase family hydrolase